MLYSSFWVIPRRLNFTCRRFGTHCYVFIGGVSRKNNSSQLFFLLKSPMAMELTACSETSTRKIQTPRHHPKGRIQH